MIKYVCADSMEWLGNHADVGAIFTSLPDAGELNQTIEEWKPWFSEMLVRCLDVATVGMPSIFYQTDRKEGGRWVSKAELVMSAGRKCGLTLLWHKIVLRGGVGKIDLYRPGYTHLIAFGKGIKVGKPTPDVIPLGKFLWNYGMNIEAAKVGLTFIQRFGNDVCDPFCGKGTVLAVAKSMGMSGIGIDIDPHRIEDAKNLKLKDWNNILSG